MTPKTKPDHDAVFVTGYDKGHADGIAQVLAVVNIAVDLYPNRLAENAERLLPGDSGRRLALLIHAFGERAYKKGQKDQKAWMDRKRKEAMLSMPTGGKQAAHP